MHQRSMSFRSTVGTKFDRFRKKARIGSQADTGAKRSIWWVWARCRHSQPNHNLASNQLPIMSLTSTD